METIGWGLRVYGRSLGSMLMVRGIGQVLGLVVQCFELGLSLQFTYSYCKQEADNCLLALKPLQ